MGVNLKQRPRIPLKISGPTFTILDPIAGATQGAKLAFKEMSPTHCQDVVRNCNRGRFAPQ